MGSGSVREMELTEFILARTAEDEARIEGIHQGEGDPDFFWGPARVLAECEAKRQAVEFYRANMFDLGTNADHAMDKILVRLAAVYSDHPDFDEGWWV